MPTKTRVLIVDDSAAMRQLLTHILESDPSIEVVGTAPDPYVARDKIKQLNPDVLTLDVEMPRMDGLTFLEKLMRGHPMPVVMVSSLTQAGCDVTLQRFGDRSRRFLFQADPRHSGRRARRRGADRRKGKSRRPRAGAACLPRAPTAASPGASAGSPSRSGAASYRLTHQVIAIGGSTGGTEALREVLMTLPPDSPGHCHGAAHASRLHAHLCRASGQPLRRAREGSVRRRPGAAGPCPARAGQLPYGAAPLGSGVFGGGIHRGRRSICTGPPWTFCSTRAPSTPAETSSARS